MPRTLHILGFRSNGKAELVSGPDVSINDTRAVMVQAKASGQLPPGLVRLEVFDSDEGRVSTVLPHDGGASHRAEVAAIEAAKPKPDPSEPTHQKRRGNQLKSL